MAYEFTVYKHVTYAKTYKTKDSSNKAIDTCMDNIKTLTDLGEPYISYSAYPGHATWKERLGILDGNSYGH